MELEHDTLDAERLAPGMEPGLDEQERGGDVPDRHARDERQHEESA